jgi:hypothetical protein
VLFNKETQNATHQQQEHLHHNYFVKKEVISSQMLSETVFTLDKNYRVKSKEFCDLLGRLRTGEPTQQDAEIILNLHIGLYKSDIQARFMSESLSLNIK